MYQVAQLKMQQSLAAVNFVIETQTVGRNGNSLRLFTLSLNELKYESCWKAREVTTICQDYITEKFFVNGLGHWVVPVVMGAPLEDYQVIHCCCIL